MNIVLTLVCARSHRAVWPAAAACALLLSGCARGHAKVAPDRPALDMPEPPPRDVEPTDAEVPAPMPLPGEPARLTPPRTRPPQRTEPAKSEPKPEPKIEVAPEAPKTTEEPPHPAPPTTLQTMPPGAEGEIERTIRGTLGRATTDLSRVDYRGLNPDARNQYDTAKNFIRQAEVAMTAKNLAFAKTLADKSAVLAAQLAGR